MVCHLCNICLKCISIFTCSLSPSSLGFCLFLFWHQHLEPLLEVISDQTWEASSMRPYMMPRPPSTTPRSLLMPASLIAPTQANIPTISITTQGHRSQLRPGVPLSARREYYTSTAAADGRSAYEEWTPPYSFAERLAPPRQLGCERPPCQSDPPAHG